MTPTWTIMIATLGQRADRLRRLLDVLLPQVDAVDGRVNVLALWNNGERPLCAVRQDLLDEASGVYVSFVDDDDLVPSFFVRQILPLLNGKIHYVGWRMQCHWDGVKLKPTYHSLRYGGWYEDEEGYYRDVSHLNPVRRDIARRARFCDELLPPPEDVSWADAVRPFVRTERYVDDVMYHYDFRTTDSTWWPGSVRRDVRHERVTVDSPHFTWHPKSSSS